MALPLFCGVLRDKDEVPSGMWVPTQYLHKGRVIAFSNLAFNTRTPNTSILIYIQQGATLHSLFYLETALHVSSGTTTHHQEHKQLYLQHLVFVTPLLLSATIAEELELV
jgi:hypothetical protein